MAYYGSKGFYVSELKKMGVRKHPTEDRKLESYKEPVLRNLYFAKKEELEAAEAAK